MDTLNDILTGYAEYWEKLRRVALRVAVVFAGAFVIGFLETGNILRLVIRLFHLSEATIVTTSPFQFLDVATKMGLYAGLAVSVPIGAAYAYAFLKDGLSRRERRLVVMIVPVGLLLFAAGAAYGYLILVVYLNSVSALNVAFGLRNVWDVSSFMFQVIASSAFLGLIFEFPIVLTALIRAGIVRTETLRRRRMYAIAGIFLFVGLLPPPDVFSTIFQALPLVLIYEATLRVNGLLDRRRAASSVPAVTVPSLT